MSQFPLFLSYGITLPYSVSNNKGEEIRGERGREGGREAGGGREGGREGERRGREGGRERGGRGKGTKNI